MRYHRVLVRIAALLLGVWIASCAPVGSDQTSGQIGKPAADFSLTSVQGQTVKLSDLKGSVVVVDFWATWCPPCRASLPNLNRLSGDANLAKRGLKVLAVNSQESHDDVKTFLDNNHYTMPVLLDTDGSAERVYNVSSLPTTLVVGRDGSIKYLTEGFDPQTSEKELSDAIGKALSQ